MRFFQVILCVLSLAPLAGCHETFDPQYVPKSPAYRVKGRLFIGNTVAANVRIGFHPVDPMKSQGRSAVGLTRLDGSFELTTYKIDDGAPEGDYTVTAIWLDESTMPIDECECVNTLQHDRFGAKYADPQKTELMATVKPQNINEVNLCVEAVERPKLPGTAQKQDRKSGNN